METFHPQMFIISYFGEKEFSVNKLRLKICLSLLLRFSLEK